VRAQRYELRDRVVLITGAARGIGAETARRLVARGARVAILDIDAAAARRVAAELDGAAVAFHADATDWASLNAAIAGTVERFGGIDVVVANAGIAGPTATVRTIEPETFERVIEINLLGVWRTIRAALPSIVERRGYVLAVSSAAAAMSMPLWAAYAASKAGCEAFARSLRSELAHTGTRVGVAYFGEIKTDMTDGILTSPAARKAYETVPKFMSGAIPVQRAGAAIVRGIERRANVVSAPRYVRTLLKWRGQLAALDGRMAGDERMIEAIRLAEAEASRDGGLPGPAAAPAEARAR